MSYSIIGGADGPTSIFLAGKIGTGWFNIYGLVFLILLLIPNVVYAIKFRNIENKCKVKWANILEQIGRYASMFFMVFTFGSLAGGWASVEALFCYFFGSIILLVLYWLVWLLYFIEQKKWKSMTLAIVPTLLFLLGGMTMQNILAIIFAMLFGIGHIFVTYQNSHNK